MRSFRRFLAAVAAILFVVAALLAAGVVSGGNATVWQDAGLVAVAAVLFV